MKVINYSTFNSNEIGRGLLTRLYYLVIWKSYQEDKST